jgi:putative heme-binding domain-containing protein
VLFGEGGKIGPDLTVANRKDKDFLLTSIVDPSAVIRKEFLNYIVKTKDGRTIIGSVAEETAAGLTLANVSNERTTVARDAIASMEDSGISLMPEGLLHALTPQELRDLFSYIQGESPTPKK